ncbi:MAG: hypothetical protein DBX55_03800 [Verrucomicrobia bacterium]|nr:MAG: hypothetical protein DBX55_03800 [Verrucomicrobiota bacterium]
MLGSPGGAGDDNFVFEYWGKGTNGEGRRFFHSRKGAEESFRRFLIAPRFKRLSGTFADGDILAVGFARNFSTVGAQAAF